MIGYYRKFCRNFSSVAAPLTDLLKKDKKYEWDDNCEKAFMKIKTLLLTAPVLIMPDYQKPFKLQVDASDYGAGAVLLQEGAEEIDLTSLRNLTNINGTIPHVKRRPWL